MTGVYSKKVIINDDYDDYKYDGVCDDDKRNTLVHSDFLTW